MSRPKREPTTEELRRVQHERTTEEHEAIDTSATSNDCAYPPTASAKKQTSKPPPLFILQIVTVLAWRTHSCCIGFLWGGRSRPIPVAHTLVRAAFALVRTPTVLILRASTKIQRATA